MIREFAHDKLFELIGYDFTDDDIKKYKDCNEPLPVQIHNLAIGLLLDNKWSLDSCIDTNCYRLKILGEELEEGRYFENSYIPEKENYYNFKYLQHPILTRKNYNEFLKSRYWEIVKALKYFDNTIESCQLCGGIRNGDLHLHHTNYAVHGFEHLPSIRNLFLTSLCPNCHNLFHTHKKASHGWE